LDIFSTLKAWQNTAWQVKNIIEDIIRHESNEGITEKIQHPCRFSRSENLSILVGLIRIPGPVLSSFFSYLRKKSQNNLNSSWRCRNV
jgi:hypothetical protein